MIYLTLHGADPGEDSLGSLQRDQIACISYESDVLAWLDDLIKEVARVPQIREILAHYQALLRKLTGKSTGELVMDLQELLGQRQGDIHNFALVPKIAEAMTAFSIEMEWNFWQTLKERLSKVDERPWRLTALDPREAGSIPLKEADHGVISHAHTGTRNRWRYGWTFRIESDAERNRYSRDGVEVMLRVECDDWGWGFYGFMAVERTADGLRRLSGSEDEGGLFDEWGERLSELLEDGWRTNAESWIAWTYPSTNLSLQKTTWLSPDELRRFVEDGAIDPLVADVQGTIDALEGWEGPSNTVVGRRVLGALPRDGGRTGVVEPQIRLDH